MRLRPGRVEEMVRESKAADTAIICHDTLDGPNAVCRGFFQRHDTLVLRLAKLIGRVRYVEVTDGEQC